MSEDVFVKTSRSTGNSLRFYHTDKDCRLLAKAMNSQRKNPAQLPDDAEECPACAGTINVNGTEEPFATRDKLLATDADAVGDSA